MALAGTIVGWVGLGLVILFAIVLIAIFALAAGSGAYYSS